MITCREVHEFLHDYFSGSLPAEEKRVFEEHLRACPPCVAYLESYDLTVKLGKEALRAPAGDPPPPLPEELVRAILAARKKRG